MSEKEMQGGQSIQEQYKEMGERKKNAKKISTKVKGHLKRHKTKYIVGGVGLTAGVGIGAYLGNKGIINIQLFNSGSVEQHLSIDKSVNILSRRGHAGNIVRCIETGETFASQNRAAEVFGVSGSTIASHLKGKTTDVHGYTFEKVGSFNQDAS